MMSEDQKRASVFGTRRAARATFARNTTAAKTKPARKMSSLLVRTVVKTLAYFRLPNQSHSV